MKDEYVITPLVGEDERLFKQKMIDDMSLHYGAYIVKANEKLADICARLKVEMRDVMHYTNIQNPDDICAGMYLSLFEKCPEVVQRNEKLRLYNSHLKPKAIE